MSRNINLLLLQPGISLRSCRSQFFAESLHFTADHRLGKFGVMAGHVGVRMSEDFGQDVDRHSVFDRHAGERMAEAMEQDT